MSVLKFLVARKCQEKDNQSGTSEWVEMPEAVEDSVGEGTHSQVSSVPVSSS